MPGTLVVMLTKIRSLGRMIGHAISFPTYKYLSKHPIRSMALITGTGDNNVGFGRVTPWSSDVLPQGGLGGLRRDADKTDS